ncbi:lipopolysaccharide biosynthesis protein [Actinoplanes subglobosus]|uniref:Lipopolysaccharide biosynthesis protein n=1 Tax=Actinoplanes subglobosus TaxID=1547892 RepID=A0ABV8J0T7_9ACTN
MLITAARRLSGDSLARNSLLIMATTVSNGGLGYFYWLLAARSVPPNHIGTATALISAATAVSMIANLGAGHMFIQRLPGSDAATWSRIVGAGLFLGSAATAATATAAALIIPLFSGNFGFLTGAGGTSSLVAAAIAVTLTTLLDNLYVAHRAGHGMLIRNLAVSLGKIVTLLVLLATGVGGAAAVLVSYIIPTLLISLLTISIGTRGLRPRTGSDPTDSAGSGPADSAGSDPANSSGSSIGRCRIAALAASGPVVRGRAGPGRQSVVAGLRTELPHLRAAITGHHLINLTQAGPAALLPVLVTARLGSDANAHFYVAWMTASMLFMVSPAVASALYAERTNAVPVPVSRAATVVLSMVGVPAAVLLFAGDRILALFSAGYAAEGGLLLQILVLAALPDAVANLAVAHWRSANEFRLCRRLNLVRALTCLSLAWLLLPGSGVTGAGVAWLTGQAASAVLVAAVALTRRRPRSPAVAQTSNGDAMTGVSDGSRTPEGEGAVGVPQKSGEGYR